MVEPVSGRSFRASRPKAARSHFHHTTTVLSQFSTTNQIRRDAGFDGREAVHHACGIGLITPGGRRRLADMKDGERLQNLMNTLKCSYFFPIALSFLQSVFGQGFVNLNFEQAVFKPDPSDPSGFGSYYASNAIPGWTPTGGIAAPDVGSNLITLGAYDISLVDTNGWIKPLDGKYSIWLYGGAEPPVGGVSISQTGVVPLTAQSIQFKANFSTATDSLLLLSLGGQNIPFFELSSTANYTIFGGDISAFAGQLETLTFALPPGNNNIWELDDIQFSSSPVPEPSSIGLLALGAMGSLWPLKRFILHSVLRHF